MKPVISWSLALVLSLWPATLAWANSADKLTAQLESKYARVRLQAAQALGRIGATARPAVPALGKALRDTDEDVREAAGKALARIGPAAVPVLIEELRNPQFAYARRAAQALAVIGPDAAAAVPALALGLKSSDAGVRAMAAHALAEIGPAAARTATALTLLLDDPGKEVKKQARGALAQIGRQAMPALRGALKSANPGIRRQAAELLGLLGAEARDALPDLAALLADKNAPVRRAAILALGALGPAAREVSDDLLRLAKDREPQVRAAAASALGDVSGSGGAPVGSLVAMFRDPVHEVRLQAVRAVIKIGPSAVNVLINSIPSEDLATRLLAMFALGEIGPAAKDAVPALLEQYQGPLPMVRSAAAVALGKIGPDGARKALPALKDSLAVEAQSPVRVSIRLALAQLQPDDPAALQELSREVIANNQNLFRVAVSNALRPRTPLENQRQLRIKGILNFYVYRNSFRFGDGLDGWSHQLLSSLGVEAIPSMVDTLNMENFAGGKEGYVFGGIPVANKPPISPISVFFK